MRFLRENWPTLVIILVVVSLVLTIIAGRRATRVYHEECHKHGGIVIGNTGFLQCVKVEAGMLVPMK